MNDDIWKRAEIASPCIKICMIHPESGLCTGCLRTREEIALWSSYTPADRSRIMEALPDRKSQHARRRGGRAARLNRKDG